MPARSKSQQRLFGMVHAYNKGEFHGSRSLRKRIADLSKHISDTDARHFAQTPHKGLPEVKKAQAFMRPEDAQAIYSRIPKGVYADMLTPRSDRRRSFLSRVLSGAAAGTVVGGVTAGGLSAFLAHKAMQSKPDIPREAVANALREAAIRGGLWGAGRGAIAGSVTGVGLSILDKLRG